MDFLEVETLGNKCLNIVMGENDAVSFYFHPRKLISGLNRNHNFLFLSSDCVFPRLNFKEGDRRMGLIMSSWQLGLTSTMEMVPCNCWKAELWEQGGSLNFRSGQGLTRKEIQFVFSRDLLCMRGSRSIDITGAFLPKPFSIFLMYSEQ